MSSKETVNAAIAKIRLQLREQWPSSNLEWGRLHHAAKDRFVRAFIQTQAGRSNAVLMADFRFWAWEVLHEYHLKLGSKTTTPETCAALVRDGHTIDEICFVTGLCKSTVQECLKEAAKRSMNR